ncbi:epoxide hydrolase family protein [Kribbella sp. NPDC051587]|uniref:epoxide hydrolase family protein n=1 Tax=Kribbella sp. NPDC051587 TaxID=3364119 RepID=UPI0037B465D0
MHPKSARPHGAEHHAVEAAQEAVASTRSGPSRRNVLQGGLAVGVAGAALTALGSTSADAAISTTDSRGPGGPAKVAVIRPYRVRVPRQQVLELRSRVAATRWPTKELVSDRSQGVQLAAAQRLARYWGTDYSWSRFEKKINAVPQFMTTIDDMDIHFIHVRSRHKNALPLIITHGWPGSFIEMLEVIGPLTNPTAHGGSATDAFDLVVPSMPGYGFSGHPVDKGWDAGRMAQTWAALMARLGYKRWVAQGGDVGASVTDLLARQAPAGLAGVHFNLLTSALRGGAQPVVTAEERTAAAAVAEFSSSGNGYLIEQSTRPQTIGTALADSPMALAAWMLDHDTDSYNKIARAFLGGPAAGNLTRDHVLDNITMYWLTGSGVSAARSYWENAQARARAVGQTPAPVKIPVGFSAFPGEILQAPRSWVEQTYPTLAYYNKPARGGHFAAWEEPQLFAAEVRAAFRALR